MRHSKLTGTLMLCLITACSSGSGMEDPGTKNNDLDKTAPSISDIKAVVTHDSAVITWSTNEETVGLVTFGLTVDHDRQSESATYVTGHTVSLTGLDSGRTYHFRVHSADRASNKSSSEDLKLNTTPQPDATPPQITAIRADVAADGATISWTTDEPATSRVLYGKTLSYELGFQKDDRLLTGHSVKLPGLEADTVYRFKVISVDASSNSGSSADSQFRTLKAPDTTKPQISAIAVKAELDAVTVSWNTDEPATSQVWFGKTTGYELGQFSKTQLVTSHQIRIQSLTQNTTYNYKVVSADASSNAAESANQTFKTLADTTPPVISAIGVKAGVTDLTITWKTDELATSEVQFGKTTGYELGKRSDSTLVVDHQIQITGLTANTQYHLKLVSVDAANNAGASGNQVHATLASGGGNPAIPGLSEEAIQIARTSTLIWFNPSLSGGAHCWIFEGGEFAKAATAFVGDTRLDAEHLAQIRHVLKPGNGLSCTGGFQDQKQLCMTTSFLLAKLTPRIWGQLTAAEKERIDTMVFAALVSSAFTTSDNNPYVKSNGQQRTMDGFTNYHRDWNPNYRNGNLGTVIVAALYFGPAEAQKRLKAHDHAAFIARCKQLDLKNILWTYENPASTRPSLKDVESTMHADYRYYGIPLTHPMELYLELTEYTYNRKVHTGLNNGQGVRGSSNNVLGGYMAKGQAGLPNKDVLGMLLEFDSGDAGGPRSSAHYANDGWYPNNYIQYALVATGSWVDSPRARAVLERVRIGTTDLLYKLDPALGGGYYNLESGSGSSSPEKISDEYGHRINRSVADVLQRYHAARNK